MTISSRRGRIFMLLMAPSIMLSHPAKAAGTSDDAPVTGDSGFTILSNATNVTHWGLGGGVGFAESPYRGYGSNVTPLPVFFFDDKWVHALGTTIDVKVGTWNHLSVTLRGKYALGDGYKGSDAPILNGMEKRKGAFWVGPALSWETGFGVATADVLTGGNKGQQADLGFSKAFDVGGFDIVPHVGLGWTSSKYVDYYYGVRSSEVTADRPFYSGTAAYEESIGTRINYKITRQQSALVDVGVSHLSSGITDSPLVGKKFIPQVRFAYIYQFK
jgi:outer membrane protein